MLMKSSFLINTVAAVLLAGTSFASAQSMDSKQDPKAAPSAQSKPADNKAMQDKAAQDKAAQDKTKANNATTGQGNNVNTRQTNPQMNAPGGQQPDSSKGLGTGSSTGDTAKNKAAKSSKHKASKAKKPVDANAQKQNQSTTGAGNNTKRQPNPAATSPGGQQPNADQGKSSGSSTQTNPR
jgi:hypothetical protein